VWEAISVTLADRDREMAILRRCMAVGRISPKTSGVRKIAAKTRLSAHSPVALGLTEELQKRSLSALGKIRRSAYLRPTTTKSY
jgi:hypothetical protein